MPDHPAHLRPVQGHAAVEAAAGPLLELLDTLGDDQLGLPTPCADYTVRGLVNHLLFWGPSLIGAATRTPVSPPAGTDQDADVLDAAWRDTLAAQTTRMVTAWRDPAAWDGETSMTGARSMPAAMIGGMVCTELVVHGWDLARAVGSSPRWPDEVLEYLRGELAATAELARSMDVYGPEVTVAPDAPPLARVLGLTGRDPNWTAPA
jgi:uncharacterized protein (TIGR03086 family)